MTIFEGEHGKKVKDGFSMHFDKTIPDWLKNRRKLKREIKRRFMEEMKLELSEVLKEEVDKMLYGDPSAEMPVGILNCKELTRKENINDKSYTVED